MKQIRVRHYTRHEQFALNKITVVDSWRLSSTADIVKDMQAGTEERGEGGYVQRWVKEGVVYNRLRRAGSWEEWQVEGLEEILGRCETADSR